MAPKIFAILIAPDDKDRDGIIFHFGTVMMYT